MLRAGELSAIADIDEKEAVNDAYTPCRLCVLACSWKQTSPILIKSPKTPNRAWSLSESGKKGGGAGRVGPCCRMGSLPSADACMGFIKVIDYDNYSVCIRG